MRCLDVRTVVYLGDGCLIDPAGRSSRQGQEILRILARAGWQCSAITMSQFELGRNSELLRSIPELDSVENAGTVVNLIDDELTHRILVTGSEERMSASTTEVDWATREAQEMFERLCPELVLMQCSDCYASSLSGVKAKGAAVVMLADRLDALTQWRGNWNCVDAILATSQAMGDHAARISGCKVYVLPNLVKPCFNGERNLLPARIARRQQRHITTFFPNLANGGLFFLNLVGQAQTMAPDLKFRAIESPSWGAADWRREGVATAELTMLEWTPYVDHFALAYEEASIVLAPAVRFEATNWEITQALASGVPILATRVGDIPEQIDGGGFLFDPPSAMVRDALATPGPKDLHLWLHYMRLLMRDDDFYYRAVRLALDAARRRYAPSREESLLSLIDQILERT